jgi:hypothetical protein
MEKLFKFVELNEKKKKKISLNHSGMNQETQQWHSSTAHTYPLQSMTVLLINFMMHHLNEW